MFPAQRQWGLMCYCTSYGAVGGADGGAGCEKKTKGENYQGKNKQ